MRGRVRRQVILIHKWIGVSVGVLLAMWLVTGIFMILPKPRALPPIPINYDSMTISPAQAVMIARAQADGNEIRGVALRQLGDRLLYQVNLVGSGPVLVDGQRGTVVQITDSLVLASVRKGFGPEVEIERVEYLERHTMTYLFGPLPAYRVEIGDSARSVVHVAVRDGSLQASTGRGRFLGAMGKIHTFRALSAIRVDKRMERWLIILTSAVSLMLVVTGYFLSLRIRRSRNRNATQPKRSVASRGDAMAADRPPNYI